MPISDYLRGMRAKVGHERILAPSVTGIVINDKGEILLQRVKDDGKWYLPGGIMDPGEQPATSMAREIWEETGLKVIPERISSVETEPLLIYPNGDQMLYVSITFACRPVSGTPHPHDDESLEVRYFAPDHMPPLNPQDRQRIAQALKGDARTFFDPNTMDFEE